MVITIFIAMKFRIGYETEITDYVRDTIEVDSDVPPEAIAEMIHDRIDSLNITLNKSVSAQLHSLAS
jgi:hypothetical protein